MLFLSVFIHFNYILKATLEVRLKTLFIVKNNLFFFTIFLTIPHRILYSTIGMLYNSSKSIKNLFGFSRQQLYYWRKKGIFLPSKVTKSGRYHYCFHDFVALKTIRILKEKKFSTYQIRNIFASLKKRFPEINNPFVEKPVVITGNRVAIIDRGKVYDALSGQMLIIDISEIEIWVKKIEKSNNSVSFKNDDFFFENPKKREAKR